MGSPYRPSSPPLRLMLAETPSPHGSGASRVTVGTLSEGIGQRVTLLPYLVGYCRWNNRSGPYNLPDNQPCDLVSQCFLLTVPFRGMLLTPQGGPRCLAPTAHQIPVYLMVFSTFLCRAFTAQYLYTPRYCYISPLCFTAQRRVQVHDRTRPRWGQ